MMFETNIHNLEDLKKSYDQDGYNHIPALFSKADMEVINKEFDRYIKDCVPKMKDQEVYYVDKTNKDTLMQMQKLEEYDKFFYDLFYNSKIKDLAANALGEDVVPRAMEYFNKPPGKSNPTPPHQDGYYFNLDNDKAVTGWMALEDVDDENGCIHYVKGSHKQEYRPHGKSEILGFSQGVTDFGTEEDKKNTVKFEGKAGMFLMHDAKIIHFATPNKSSVRSRRAFGFVYHGVSAKQDIEKGKAYQKKLHDELRVKEII
jgi:phytanoyl-CoA hydroxylase